MPDSRPVPRDAYSLQRAEAPTQVTFDDLARLPAQRLARLLLDRAAEDPTLLGRLYDTIDRGTAETIERNGRAATAIPQAGSNIDGQNIVGQSLAMRRVASLISRFEQTDDPVLITGESGTGKELLAQAIHRGSSRRDGRFVALNCAAIPPSLVASELFGYEKGAFTGASGRSLGQIEHANGGTLFLDEIGDMPIDLQGHLLRFLQEGQIRRIGGRETINLNVRIVSATNVQLDQAIAEGRFREDLFYRLNVMTVPVPPLRDRRDDIAPLAHHFLRIAARDFSRVVSGFTPDAAAALLTYRWPGNVRELMSVIRRAVAVGDGPLIDTVDLTGLSDRAPAVAALDAKLETAAITADPLLKPGSPEERLRLLRTLEQTAENITSSASVLGVSRVTLYRMLRRHSVVLKRGMADPPLSRLSPAPP